MVPAVEFRDSLKQSNLNDNIAGFNEKINSYKGKKDIRYSIKEESDGNKLTEEQKEYFKNSQIRDEDSNLPIVYHVGYYLQPTPSIYRKAINMRCVGYISRDLLKASKCNANIYNILQEGLIYESIYRQRN